MTDKNQNSQPVIGIVMGSDSDWPVMQAAAKVLRDFGVPFEAKVVSAHRTPDLLYEYAEAARSRGLKAI
ncbi:MAG: AIR carboxylase family protein, partial [Rhodocyclaceae bacterium]|nr:AIR carboxylase family protein [Rhodocyclaceae bacterium]